MNAAVLIFDGRHLLWRTADAFKDLSAEVNGRDMGTGAMYGFLSCAMKIHNRYGGMCMVAWEGQGNFRRKLWPAYKQRAEPDAEMKALADEMRAQELRLKAMLRAIGVRQYCGVGYEADDVIGTVARNATLKGMPVVIYSGDSDLRQLVNDNVTVVSPGYRSNSDKTYNALEVEEKHGVPPDKIADLKALAGDNSDGIPGIRGIGPKTAAQAIQGLGGIEKIIRAAQSGSPMPIPERFRAPISEGAEMIRLFKRLTTIETRAQMRLIDPKPDQATLLKHLRVYRFRSLMAPAELHGLMKMGEMGL